MATTDSLRPIASLSLDLDNKWSYLKTHGEATWRSFPSYFELVVPRILRFLEERDLIITVFVVGQDAAIEGNRQWLQNIAAAGHEIGNHSFRHEPWLHLYSLDELEADLGTAEQHICEVTGQKPIGFRGPGFSCSRNTLRVLARRGYKYDASVFPTYLGPIARAYYFMTAKLDSEERRDRKELFGKFREGLRSNKPCFREIDGQQLLEIPVTTMPIFKIPIHASYLLYLANLSRTAAQIYFHVALRLCRLCGVAPSMLLHPLDFLGGDDEPDLSFFPAMNMSAEEKVEFVGQMLEELSGAYRIVPMREHARILGARIPALDVSGPGKRK